jgi:hypothetical protein
VKHVRVLQAMAIIATVAIVVAAIAAVAPASVRHLIRIESSSTRVVAGEPLSAELLVPIPRHGHLAVAFDDGKLKAVRVHHHRFQVSTKKLTPGTHMLIAAFINHRGHRIAWQKAKFGVTHKDGGGSGGGSNPPTTTSPGGTTPKPPTTTSPKPPTTTSPKPPTTTSPKPPTTTPKPPTTTPTSPGDAVSPTTPGALLVTGAGQTVVMVSWHASNDNVGVVGYRLTRSGAAALTVSGTSTAIGGLACGSSVTVSVVALDAAGNASTPASASGSTAACPVVAADHYVSTSGSDGGPCSQAAPCATLGRAYQASSPGQTISVAPGSYPGQTIPADPSKSGANVVFVGNGASTGEIVVDASHVTLENFNTGGWTASEGTSDLTFQNVNITRGEFFVNSAVNVSVIGGVVDGAGQYWTNGNQVKTMSSSSTVPSGILFDGVTIQNFRRDPSGSDHVDCLHVMAANGITIRNSHFANCEAFDVLFTVFLGPTPSNILIENNFFHCCGSGFYSVQLGGGHGEDFHNATIRNNSSDKSFTVGTSNTLTNVAFYNNDVPDIGGCDRNGVTADYNVLFDTSAKCGPHDLNAAAGFVSATDLHLMAGAPAINAGLASQAPATDIDGQGRPQGPAVDIGADEAG